MNEQLLAGDGIEFHNGDELLVLDPSDQAAGSTTIVDKSGKAVPVTNTGVVVADKGPTEGVKSMYFRAGVWNYLRMPAANVPNILKGDFTIEYYWCPETISSSYRTILGCWRQAVGAGGALAQLINNSTLLAFGPYSESGAIVTVPGVQLNTWSHWAWVRQGNVFKVYQDGVLQFTTSAAAFRESNTADWMVGAYLAANNNPPPSGNVPLNGWLSKIKVYNRAKYTRNFTPE